MWLKNVVQTYIIVEVQQIFHVLNKILSTELILSREIKGEIFSDFCEGVVNFQMKPESPSWLRYRVADLVIFFLALLEIELRIGLEVGYEECVEVDGFFFVVS